MWNIVGVEHSGGIVEWGWEWSILGMNIVGVEHSGVENSGGGV